MIASFGRFALAVFVAAFVLIGCSTAQLQTPASRALRPQAQKQSQTFQLTYSEQTFTVPTNVNSVKVTALGAGTLIGTSTDPASGRGGEVIATIPVTPGETLYVFVGGEGGRGGQENAGGWNGGGAGGGWLTSPYALGIGGGGASDIRQGGDALGNRVIVAGGGGGEAINSGGTGGSGGGKIGQPGASSRNGRIISAGGGGGKQKKGGAGGPKTGGPCHGAAGQTGTLGQGGCGGAPCYYDTSGGGGGGGGYYGGGGGAGAGGCPPTSTCQGGLTNGGGGGGGSSYIEKQAKRVTNKQGVQRGDGKITISWP